MENGRVKVLPNHEDTDSSADEDMDIDIEDLSDVVGGDEMDDALYE